MQKRYQWASTWKGDPIASCEVMDFVPLGCLRCPLPVCRYETPRWAQKGRVSDRDGEVRALRDGGLTVDEIARRLQVSGRTVGRSLARMAAGSTS